jgi:neutral ceramidase
MEATSPAATLTSATDRFDITPDYPVSLLGYFNDRVSTGVIDPLYARLLAVRKGSSRALLVQIDSCLIPTADAEYLRGDISGGTEFEPHEILICTNHTHTAPALTDFFAVKSENRYRSELYETLLKRVKRLTPYSPCLVRGTRGRAPGLSHNRRWYMRDGTVTTNPARGSAERLRPEGPVDEGVEIIGFFSPDERPLALIVSISNHTDTVGGTRISADWTGWLERVLNGTLKDHFPVLTLIAPQGNINHYEFDRYRDQTNPGEAERIGRAYADVVLSCWGGLRQLAIDGISGLIRTVKIKPREVEASAFQRARETLARAERSQGPSDLKAEDLQDPEALRLFARELIAFLESRPFAYDVPLQVLRVGEVIFCAIPGEPFVEIGLELKGVGTESRGKVPREKMIVPVALANGYFGYIPLEPCFDRGGYEVQPGRDNCLSRKAAGIITAELKDMLESIISTRAE